MCGGRCVGYDPRSACRRMGVEVRGQWMSYVHSHIPYTPYFRSACSARVNRLSSHTTSRHPAGSSRYAAYAIPCASRNRIQLCSGDVRLFGFPFHPAASLILFMSFLSTLSVTTFYGSISISRVLLLSDLALRPGAAAARAGTSRWFRRSSGRLQIPRLGGSGRCSLPPAARRRTRGAGVWSVRLVWSLFPPVMMIVFFSIGRE